MFSARSCSCAALRSLRMSRIPRENRSRSASVTFFVPLQSRTSACDLRSSGASPRPRRIARRGLGLQRLPLDDDLALVHPVEAVDEAQELGAPGADEAAEPDDLARAHLEARLANRREAASRREPRAAPARLRPGGSGYSCSTLRPIMNSISSSVGVDAGCRLRSSARRRARSRGRRCAGSRRGGA